MQCQAKCKSTGEQCRRRAVNGKRVCTVHGGLTPSGVASANWKHGRYSKAIPTRLMERYQASESDPELLNLRSDIALVDARISELLGSVDVGESGRLWRDLGKLRKDFLVAQREKDQDAMASVLTELLNTVGRGAQDWERWQEIADFLERRRRLVESEQKRLVAMQQMVTAEQAMTLVTTLGLAVREIVLEHVDADTGRAILSKVQQELIRVSAAGTRGEVNG